MNRFSVAVAALSLGFPFVAIGQSTMQTASLTTPASEHGMHSLMKSAHSGDQYRELAAYFHQREVDYRAKASAENKELDRLPEANARMAQKYPRPADSAEYRYELYLSGASKAAAQARRYDQLAADPEPSQQQGATSFPGGS